MQVPFSHFITLKWIVWESATTKTHSHNFTTEMWIPSPPLCRRAMALNSFDLYPEHSKYKQCLFSFPENSASCYGASGKQTTKSNCPLGSLPGRNLEAPRGVLLTLFSLFATHRYSMHTVGQKDCFCFCRYWYKCRLRLIAFYLFSHTTLDLGCEPLWMRTEWLVLVWPC